MQIYYLQMLSETDLAPSPLPDDLSIVEIETIQPEFNLFLYSFVGKHWQWTGKLTWSLARWQNYIESNKIRTWVGYSKGAIVGYYELNPNTKNEVEIMYFGLTASFIGKGYGGALLNHAVESAWAIEGTKKVWLHTCDLDHPNALNNYKKRGFSLYKIETENS
ncbi:hypothetical protein PSECIP111854_01190 [Pseudoalteromonas sp. CIP111854]|uniref:N-acetyltransferase domain-containing protein n=1 Tax=Pseudoalteromonas holothuriae TaxID=2963714 RepID=A0A9W4QUA4_9GAMM|nr:GNAT family N-acetyltransferase [Pseudoalteromonas sp. CIP111854]CAH9053539.1 hypothetical protein PSECIP111854_01190 [Pseudoalteromonas sp. CIP111854]